MVVLVPRQLRMTGMTGDVPYYGGRLTPWHIQGIEQAAAAQATPAPPGPPPERERTLEAMRHLLDRGVISQQEYDDLVARVRP